jgi:hypothetical protein
LEENELDARVAHAVHTTKKRGVVPPKDTPKGVHGQESLGEEPVDILEETNYKLQ